MSEDRHLAVVPDNAVPIHAALGSASLKSLEQALTRLADQADRLAEDGDVASLGVGLHNFRALRKQVNDLERHIEDHVAKLMDRKVMNLGDELVMERRSGNVRKHWQSVELLRHLVGDQLIDPETGENVFDILVACLPLTGSLPWRAGALREHGTNPDEWAETTPGRTSVQVRIRGAQDG